MSYLIGIDLGGSSAKAVVVRPSGEALARENATFDPDRPMDWAEKVRELKRKLEAQQGGEAETIGVSAPGLAARDGRSIAYMPGRLTGLEDLNWTEWLQARKPVPVLNDAHAALLGEVWLGAAKGCQNAILLTLGTGVGGAAMVDGNLLHGHLGRAGHLGHLCLDVHGPLDICRTPGSLELAIGNCTIRERTKGRFETTHALVDAYRAGDAGAAVIWLESIRALGCSIASFVNILDPETVIIGGGVARAGASLFDPLRKILDEAEWRPGDARVKVVSAQLGEFAGAFGAARQGTLASRKMESA